MMKIIKQFIITTFGNIRNRIIWSHRLLHIKKYKMPIYYIIRRMPPGAGFFSNYLYILGHIIYAEHMGYKPVVDFTNYRTLYSMPYFGGKKIDSWYCYFKRDENIPRLEDIYKRESYVLSDDKYLQQYCEKYCEQYGLPTEKAVLYYSPYIVKYFSIKKELLSEFQESFVYKEIKNKIGDTVGVHIRGTDMAANLTKGHPIPEKSEKYIDEIKNLCKKYPNITKIFVATDETRYIDIVKRTFSCLDILYISAYRASTEDDIVGIHISKNSNKHNGYQMGKEVLEDMYLLSQCEYLICGNSNVTNVAILNNKNQYKNLIVLNGRI